MSVAAPARTGCAQFALRSTGVLQVVGLLGPAGVGKSTQRKLLVPVGFTVVSTGDELEAKGLKDNSGGLSSDDAVSSIVENAIRTAYNRGDQALLIDGWPRTKAQAEHGVRLAEGDFDVPIRFVTLVLSAINPYELVPRIKERAELAKQEGRPVREDDLREDRINRRMAVYVENAKGVMLYLGPKQCIVGTDGMKPIEQVHAGILDALCRAEVLVRTR